MPNLISSIPSSERIIPFRDVIEQRPERFAELCQIACTALDSTSSAFTVISDQPYGEPVWFGDAEVGPLARAALSTDVINQGSTVHVQKIIAFGNDAKQAELIAASIRAYIAVPLVIETGATIGTFFITWPKARTIDAKDVFLLEGFARIAVWLMRVSQLKLEKVRTLAETKALLAKVEEQQIVLRRKEVVFGHVSRLANIGGWEYNLLDQSIYWSDQVYEIHEVLKGTTIELSEALNFYPPHSRIEISNHLRRTMETGESFEFETYLTTALGNKRTVRSLGEGELKDGRVVRVFGTFQDITEQRATEAQAAQLIKMETFGQLTGGIAHDFNNLLSSVIGNLQIFLKRPDILPQDTRELAAALQSAQRGVKLTSRLLSFARSKDLIIESFDPREVIRELNVLLREACGSRVSLVLDVGGDAWRIASDISQFETAILNLVINSRDAISSKGTIRLSIENVGTKDEQRLPKDRSIPNQYVSITVADDGSGISKDILKRVTEPFFTTKDLGKGTGLGLSLVHSLVTSSGGEMDIDSEENVGTTVTIMLPRWQQSAAEQGRHDDISHLPSASSHRKFA